MMLAATPATAETVLIVKFLKWLLQFAVLNLLAIVLLAIIVFVLWFLCRLAGSYLQERELNAFCETIKELADNPKEGLLVEFAVWRKDRRAARLTSLAVVGVVAFTIIAFTGAETWPVAMINRLFGQKPLPSSDIAEATQMVALICVTAAAMTNMLFLLRSGRENALAKEGTARQEALRLARDSSTTPEDSQ